MPQTSGKDALLSSGLPILRQISMGNITERFDILFELKVLWLFTKRDLIAVTFPGVLYTASALIYAQTSISKSILPFLLSVIYFWMLLSFFCISNQICDIEEDRVEKPDRPIVSGMVSVSDAKNRLFVVGLLNCLIALYLDILPFTLIYSVSGIINNLITAKRFWNLRIYMAALGVTAPIAIGWNMIAPITKELWMWIFYLKLCWCAFGPIQDMGDLDGDRKVGRKTFIIVNGERFTKRFMGIAGVALAIVFHIIFKRITQPSVMSLLCECILNLLSLALTYKICKSRSVKEYKLCHRLFITFYCLLLIAGSTIIASVHRQSH